MWWLKKSKISLNKNSNIKTYKKYIAQEYKLEIMDSKNIYWKLDEVKLIEEMLKIIPSMFHGKDNLKYIVRADFLKENKAVSASYLKDEKTIYIYNQLYQDTPAFENFNHHFQFVFLHELVHAFFFYNSNSMDDISLAKHLWELSRFEFMFYFVHQIAKREESLEYKSHEGISDNLERLINMQLKADKMSDEELKKYEEMSSFIEEIVDTICAYVLSPAYLQKKHNKTYLLIKNKLFQGKEYPQIDEKLNRYGRVDRVRGTVRLANN